MAAVLYRQCRIEKRVDERTTRTQVTWLPEKFARIGAYLQLRQATDNWDNGWRVLSVGSRAVSESQLPDAHATIRQHRRRTVDAAPRRK